MCKKIWNFIDVVTSSYLLSNINSLPTPNNMWILNLVKFALVHTQQGMVSAKMRCDCNIITY